MSKQVTVEIPENIYQQVEEAARATNRRVAEVITETLAESFLYQQSPRIQEVEADEEPFPPLEQVDAMDKETIAYKEMHPELWEKYPHQFVAIFQGKLIDYDKDFITLSARIDQKYPYPEHIVLLREVEKDPDPILYFRSPRLVRD